MTTRGKKIKEKPRSGRTKQTKDVRWTRLDLSHEAYDGTIDMMERVMEIDPEQNYAGVKPYLERLVEKIAKRPELASMITELLK